MHKMYVQDQKNVRSYEMNASWQRPKYNEHCLRIDKEADGTNESIDFDFPITYLMPLGFCFCTLGILKWNYYPKVIIHTMHVKLIKCIIYTNGPRMNTEILSHNLSLL